MDYIHARTRQRGWRYRLWSTSSDTYITDSCTGEEIRFEYLCRYLANTVYMCAVDIETSLARAQRSGSSGTHDHEESLTSPWRKQNADDSSVPFESFQVANELSSVVKAAVATWIESKKKKDPNWSLQELSKGFPCKEQW